MPTNGMCWWLWMLRVLGGGRGLFQTVILPLTVKFAGETGIETLKSKKLQLSGRPAGLSLRVLLHCKHYQLRIHVSFKRLHQLIRRHKHENLGRGVTSITCILWYRVVHRVNEPQSTHGAAQATHMFIRLCNTHLIQDENWSIHSKACTKTTAYSISCVTHTLLIQCKDN
jgi:hypothetical protein